MSAEVLEAFLGSPYNRIADVKMYLFFTELGGSAAIVLAVLLLLSVLIPNFWCRYLCPYGALLAPLSRLSPIAVRRDPGSCTACGRCDRACSNRVRVSTCRRVASLECTTCFQCVHACKAPGALAVFWPVSRRSVSDAAYAAILVGAFILVPQAAQSIGYWNSSTGPGLYAALYTLVGQTDHPRTPHELSDGRPRSRQPDYFDRQPTLQIEEPFHEMPRTR
jgi:polyferredoxin